MVSWNFWETHEHLFFFVIVICHVCYLFNTDSSFFFLTFLYSNNRIIPTSDDLWTYEEHAYDHITTSEQFVCYFYDWRFDESKRDVEEAGFVDYLRDCLQWGGMYNVHMTQNAITCIPHNLCHAFFRFLGAPLSLQSLRSFWW